MPANPRNGPAGAATQAPHDAAPADDAFAKMVGTPPKPAATDPQKAPSAATIADRKESASPTGPQPRARGTTEAPETMSAQSTNAQSTNAQSPDVQSTDMQSTDGQSTDAQPSAEAALDLDRTLRESQVEEILQRLDEELVGLIPVKTRIREIAHLLLVDNLRRSIGLATEKPPLHMSFTGRPGTGKTTVAMRMAQLLQRLGYVRKGQVVVATRDDLVGQYIGHTAPKTKEMVKRAMGGALFIDEAYYLYRPENERDYGGEAIEILLQVMENQRDDLVVIFAGYKDRMDSFFASNPGLSSRVAHHIDFPDYTVDELLAIAQLMLRGLNYEFGPGAEATFKEYLKLRMQQPNLANARSVRNALDRARLRAATRLFERGGTISRTDLMTIATEDLRKSRIFEAAQSADSD